MTVPPDFKVWDGVYRSFSDAPVSGPGFAGAVWRGRSDQAAREALSALAAGLPLDYSLRQRNVVLPIAVATLLDRQARVRVLDFGGGLGTSYLVLKQAVPATETQVDYTVSEIESICEAGRTLFEGQRGLVFLAELPGNEHFDLIHSASVLQYIDDWRGAIAQLASYRADLISLADIFAGPIEPFVTLQTYYDSCIPHWFLNEDILVREVERHGYHLMLRSPCNVRVLGQHGPLPMDNFPTDRRLRNTLHFLFARSAK